MRSILFSLLTVVLLLGSGCQTDLDDLGARAIVHGAIGYHSGGELDSVAVMFGFREDTIRALHRGDQYHYRRSFTDSLDRSVVEGLTNDTAYRIVDGDSTTLSKNDSLDVDSRLNSVVYFALLPAPLNDPATEFARAGRDTIDGTPYHRIRVTFQPEGGGRDWQDEYLYWFRTDTFAMDFLAYAYGIGNPDEETGTRFREAYNIRRRQGIRFADYKNYTVDTLAPDALHRYPSLREQGALELVSRVELDSVRVRRLRDDS